ncbi:MAG: cytochrome c oxidase subunit II [Thermomicrobiales bacterium]
MHRRRRWGAIALIVAAGLLAWPATVGAEANPMFDPQSGRARAVVDLTWVVLFFVALVFIIAEGLLIFALVRYRHRGEAGEPRQTFGNRRLEITWTAIPIVILIFVFILTVRAMRVIAAPPAAGDALNVTLIGHQWWWEYRYPDLGIVTANELHIPAGKTVHLQLESADVIHDFWVPQLGRKMDVVPGKINSIYVQSDNPGVFDGACAEYCGTQHAWMRIKVIADSPADFDQWVQAQKATGAQPASPDALAGRGIFLSSAGNCASCHTINGTANLANVGPDLTHVGSRTTIGAGVLTNTSDNMARWLTNPQQVKPGNLMPDLRLTPDEVRALTAYLESLK